MDDSAARLWPLFVGGYLVGYYLIWRLGNFLTRNWPTVPAMQIEVPISGLNRFNLRRLFQRGIDTTDLALAYSVDGRDYETRIKPYATSSLNGKVISKSAGLPEEFPVRYRKKNPKKIYYRHAYTDSTRLFLNVACLAIGALLLAYYLYSRVLFP